MQSLQNSTQIELNCHKRNLQILESSSNSAVDKRLFLKIEKNFHDRNEFLGTFFNASEDDNSSSEKIFLKNLCSFTITKSE